MEEKSFGIIPLRKKKSDWEVLLIQHHAGHWGFPKGHPEKGESPLQSAERELFEETGMKVKKVLSQKPLDDTYHYTRNQTLIKKSVYYFVAEVTGKLILQEEEVMAFQWVKLNDAENYITFKSAKAICSKVLGLLEE